MPVGTQGTVKGLTVAQLRQTGAEMMLGNTYHLALRPGEARIKRLGGLHAFTGWDGPMLTDSGGFQIFSLADRLKIDERGATFRSHIDGHQVQLSPERSMEIQQALGSDFAMVLDHVVALPNDASVVRQACERTIRWAARCRAVHDGRQAQMGIVQGGLDGDLRRQCALALREMDFDGYAVGGLSVGESPVEMYQVLQQTCPHLPQDRPRYLMGVGRPQDLLQAIARGVDLFDCVMPTRNGRNALAFTPQGTLRMRNAVHAEDPRPIDPTCPCPACRHSRAYLRHLFIAREMLGPILLSIHNLSYYQRLLADAREAIVQERFRLWMAERFVQWGDPLPQDCSDGPFAVGGG